MKKRVVIALFAVLIVCLMPITAKAYTYDGVDYNDDEIRQLQSFLSSPSADTHKTNGQQLNNAYDASDPSTWTGVVWESGRVTTINWQGRNLAGNLDLNNFTSLKELKVGDNSLTGLYLINDTSLSDINCYYNDLTTLDLSSNTALKNINCNNNALAILNIRTNTLLEELYCDKNKLTILDVSGNDSLKTLYCKENGMTELDTSGCTSLNYLNCDINDLTTLDISGNTSLQELYCNKNKLTTLDVSSNKSLKTLYCKENGMAHLNALGCTSLNLLHCEDNELTTLDVNGATALQALYCNNNSLTTLDVSSSPWLQTLYCYINNLTTLDVSRNPWLQTLHCAGNELTVLNVSGATCLTYLYCSVNDLATLDVSSNKFLETLQCGENALTDLNISGATALTSLGCGDNELTALDVSGMTALTYLDCKENKLTTLDVSSNTSLGTLFCDGNALTELNVRGATALADIFCDNNELTALDVSSNTSLEALSCNSNELTALDVSKNPDLIILRTSDNKLEQITAKLSGADISVKSEKNGYVELYRNFGSDFYVTAVASAPYSIVSWIQDSNELSTEAKYDLTLGTVYDLTAKFYIAAKFDSDGGSSVAPQAVDMGDKIAKPSDPTKEGYVFEGWFKEAELENAWEFDTDTVSGDTILYAKWVKVLELTLDPSDGIIYKGKTITITPNVEGGTWEFDSEYFKRDGNTFTALKVGPTKIKYTHLSQWKEIDVTVSKYSIDFDVDGGSAVDSQKLDPEEKIAKPSDPTKEGYVFEGWFKEAELENAWDFDTDTVSGDTILYAKWITVLEFIDPKKDIDVGSTTTIVPNVPGGTWEYDESYLKRDGNTFTALKAGTVRIKYTVGSQTIYIEMTISANKDLPKTGEDFTLWFKIGAVLLLAGVGLGIHSHKKKA